MKIIHFADLHLGVENYGRIDPVSGLPSRLLDFLGSLDQMVDYAIANKVDLVLFCGDVYKSRDPSQTQQREFARRIRRLSESDVPILLLIGNHDIPNALGRATTTEIFNTLAIKNVYVADHPGLYTIATPGGAVQIVALPWLRRSALLGKEDSRNLNLDQLNQKMSQVLTGIIENNAKTLDPELPSLLAVHVWVTGARIGSEESMTIGKEHVLLPGSVANPVFDYIALGHIHRHQVLAEKPPLVYAGSLERLDFGDEGDEKGFYLVEISPGPSSGARKTSFEFHPVIGRRFLTIKVGIEPQETEPMATILQAISRQVVTDAIVRLQVSLPQEIEGQVSDSELRNALKDAHYFTIIKDIKRESRLRLGIGAAEEITPIEAMKAYLEDKKYSRDYIRLLIEFGENLIQEQTSN
jgi:exonuclease SbcD